MPAFAPTAARTSCKAEFIAHLQLNFGYVAVEFLLSFLLHEGDANLSGGRRQGDHDDRPRTAERARTVGRVESLPAGRQFGEETYDLVLSQEDQVDFPPQQAHHGKAAPAERGVSLRSKSVRRLSGAAGHRSGMWAVEQPGGGRAVRIPSFGSDRQAAVRDADPSNQEGDISNKSINFIRQACLGSKTAIIKSVILPLCASLQLAGCAATETEGEKAAVAVTAERPQMLAE